MKVKVKFMPKGKKFDDMNIKGGATGLELLKKLNLAPDAHIITRKGSPIPLDEKLSQGDKINIIQVISGG